MSNLLEKPRVIEERAAECERVTAHGQHLREHKRSVEKPLRLTRGELSGEVHPSGGVDGAVKSRVLGVKTSAVPNHSR